MQAELDHAPLAHHFENPQQQHEAAVLGVWLFLATEVLFFGALLTGYAVYRYQHPREFGAASAQLKETAGAVNTAVLLTSSLTMALAVHAAATRRRRMLAVCLGLTLALGAAFLGIKAWEWYAEYREGLVPGPGFHADWLPAGTDPRAGQMFYVFYFVMTGLHGLHMIIGLGLVAWLLARCRSPRPLHTATDAVGLYWHFVDIVWIFLFPLLYLLH